ncbi:MAG: DUF1003 domain-containing protein [Pirellulales bacterium]
MAKRRAEKLQCQVCQKLFPSFDVMPIALVRSPVIERIQEEHPELLSDGFICLADLNGYRIQYVEHVLASERGELTALDAEVLSSLREQELLSENVNEQFEKDLTLGERLADKMAAFGGSWTFLACFAVCLLVWVALNSIVLFVHPFDPYPYIFLNLILSCLAAIQAPVIMMSQNRQEARDRIRAEHDYRVNLKAELEIRYLHAKLDMLLTHQWQRLLEIQEIQMDLMQEARSKPRK